MPFITAISVQRHDAAYCNIYLDQQFAFVLLAVDVAAFQLRQGMELAAAELARLEELAGATKSFRAALHYLGTRSRSRYEVQLHLRRKGMSEAEIQATLERLEDRGLLNDQAFAQMWVNDRMALRPRSRRQLEQELALKGIGRAIIQTVLNELPEDESMAALQRLVDKKRRIGVDGQKLVQYLLRQGYPYELVKRVISPDEEEDRY